MATTTRGELTLVALAELMQAMRQAQKAFAKARRRPSTTEEEMAGLTEGKFRLESEVDAALTRILRPEPRRPLPGQTSFLDDIEAE